MISRRRIELTGLTASFLAAKWELYAVVARPFSIVCKVVSANGRPAVKLSDNPMKAMGAPVELARYRRVLADGSPVDVVAFFGTDHVLGIWQDEFTMIREWGGVFVLVMHPQVTGRPMRIAILRRFIAFTRQFDDVWYATGREIAQAYAAQEGDRPAQPGV